MLKIMYKKNNVRKIQNFRTKRIKFYLQINRKKMQNLLICFFEGGYFLNNYQIVKGKKVT
jgi:hypothetical protein